MLFNSAPFIFGFLPVVLALFILALRLKLRDVLILSLVLVASLFFYSIHKPIYVLLILSSIGMNYLFHVYLVRSRQRKILHLSIAMNLLVLGVFKYADFIIDNAALVSGREFDHLNIILPLAISFFTFQQISFLCETTGKTKEPVPFLRYAIYIAFFPQLIAGPIVRFGEFFPQINKFFEGKNLARNIAVGLTIFSIGLFKKIVIADKVGMIADGVFDGVAEGETYSLIPAWLGATSYSLQIYFDFSGYSDMAIGLSRCFGIRLPINFNSPYRAASIIDFWRRWHISLSSFLRDYVYKPIGGSHGGLFAYVRNVMITMLLAGLWHGAGWTFVIWGGLHGVLLAVNRTIRSIGWAYALPMPIKVICVNVAVILAWVPFRAPDMDVSLAYWRAMFGFNGLDLPTFMGPYLSPVLERLGIEGIGFRSVLNEFVLKMGYGSFGMVPLFLGLALVFMAPNTADLFRKYHPIIRHHGNYVTASVFNAIYWRPYRAWACLAILLAFVSVVLQGRPNEFLYFQF